MADKIENFIQNNKNKFDLFEPSPDVWNRIKENKSKPKTKILNTRLIKYFIRAAVVLFIFGIGFSLAEYKNYKANKTVASIQNTPKQNVNDEIEIPELVEAEAYYSSQVSGKLQLLKKHTVNNPELQKQINFDLGELDNVLKELKNDLNDNVANVEVIDAMIQNYRLKVRVLEKILENLNESKNEDEKSSEPIKKI